jgi:hypothetical protein
MNVTLKLSLIFLTSTKLIPVALPPPLTSSDYPALWPFPPGPFLSLYGAQPEEPVERLCVNLGTILVTALDPMYPLAL